MKITDRDLRDSYAEDKQLGLFMVLVNTEDSTYTEVVRERCLWERLK